MNRGVMYTARLELVASTPAHLEAELADPARLGPMLGARVPEGWPPGLYDRDAMRYFLERLGFLGEAGAGWFGWYAIAREDDDAEPTLVGACGYMGPPTPEGTVEIGYSVVEAFRGRGYAAEMVRALVAHALATPGVSAVLAEAAAENEPSRRALARAGFRVTGAGREIGHERWRLEPPAGRAAAGAGRDPRQAAVLVPVYRDGDGAWRLVVIRRAEGGIHGGQLAFPGGTRAEGDATLFDTAVREAAEEIGLPAPGVEPLATLPLVDTRVSGFHVTPFLATIARPAAWALQAREISEVLEPPLAPLLAPGARRFSTDLLPPGRGQVRLPWYAIGPHRLWGVSERILTPLLARIAAGEWPRLHDPGVS